jgi:toxin ParE1/3/4
MTPKSCLLSPRAEADLEDIWVYTLQNWSRAQADHYHRTLMAEINALADGIKAGSRSAVRPAFFKRNCGSHVIWYRDRGDRLEIIRILHAAQDAERHLHD